VDENNICGNSTRAIKVLFQAVQALTCLNAVQQKEVEQLGALLGNHPSLCHVIGDSLVTTIHRLSRKERKVIILSKERQWILLSFGQKAKFIKPYDEMKDQCPMLSQEVFCNVSLGLLNHND
jgi:hypothetical protein